MPQVMVLGLPRIGDRSLPTMRVHYRWSIHHGDHSMVGLIHATWSAHEEQQLYRIPGGVYHGASDEYTTSTADTVLLYEPQCYPCWCGACHQEDPTALPCSNRVCHHTLRHDAELVAHNC